MPSSVSTQAFSTIAEYNRFRDSLQDKGDGRPLLGVVPTMGALHEGHAALIRQARNTCQNVVVTIFVNPLQFAPHEDFDRYPRTFQNDLRLCQDCGADAVLAPGIKEIYPLPLDRTTMVVPPEELTNRLCGVVRPHFFRGVATVVMKLFGIVRPTVAFFGEKDYQQLAVIKRMAGDLNLNIEIVGVPTVREGDGLAMSSRNVYLTAEQRQLAPGLHKAISMVAERSLSGSVSLPVALREAQDTLKQIPGISLQYLEACHADTLLPLNEAQKPMVVLIAAMLGDVRLIDNVVVR